MLVAHYDRQVSIVHVYLERVVKSPVSGDAHPARRTSGKACRVSREHPAHHRIVYPSIVRQRIKLT